MLASDSSHYLYVLLTFQGPIPPPHVPSRGRAGWEGIAIQHEGRAVLSATAEERFSLPCPCSVPPPLAFLPTSPTLGSEGAPWGLGQGHPKRLHGQKYGTVCTIRNGPNCRNIS